MRKRFVYNYENDVPLMDEFLTEHIHSCNLEILRNLCLGFLGKHYYSADIEEEIYGKKYLASCSCGLVDNLLIGEGLFQNDETYEPPIYEGESNGGLVRRNSVHIFYEDDEKVELNSMLTAQDLLNNKKILNKWLKELIDISGRNKLINISKKSGVIIDLPSSEEIFDILVVQKKKIKIAPVLSSDWANGSIDAEENSFTCLIEDEVSDDIRKKLSSIRNNNNLNMMEKGIWTSYLSLGIIKWKTDKGDSRNSPLLLVPIKISINSTALYIEFDENQDIRLNHAMPLAVYSAHKVRFDYPNSEELDFVDDTTEGVELTNLASDENPYIFDEAEEPINDTVEESVKVEKNLYAEIMDSFSNQVKEFQKTSSKFNDWGVEELSIITSMITFSEIIYRDLQKNEVRITNNDVITQFASSYIDESGNIVDRILNKSENGIPKESSFGKIDKTDRYATVGSSDSLPLIFNADNSQMAAISACLNNPDRHFLIQGPPGTGKSQTIANLIAGYLYTGKSVLFVSEKAAAVEVVNNKLIDKGLENFILNLHSPMKRSIFAAKMDNTLVQMPLRTPKDLQDDVKDLNLKKQQIAEIINILNAIHPATGLKVKDMIGDYSNGFYAKLMRLKNRQGIPVEKWILPEVYTGLAIEKPSEQDVTDIENAIRKLAETWHYVNQKEDFYWHGIKKSDPDAIGDDAKKVIDHLNKILKLIDDSPKIKDFFSVRSLEDFKEIISILELYSERNKSSNIPLSWMNKTTIDELTSVADELTTALSKFEENSKKLASFTSINIAANESFDFMNDLKSLHLKDSLTLSELYAAEAGQEALVSLIDEVISFLNGYGIDDLNHEEFKVLLSLINLEEVPNEEWLNDADFSKIKTAVHELNKYAKEVEVAKEAASEFFVMDKLAQYDIKAILEMLKAKLGAKVGLFAGKEDKNHYRIILSCTLGTNDKDKESNIQKHWHLLQKYVEEMDSLVNNSSSYNSKLGGASILEILKIDAVKAQKTAGTLKGEVDATEKVVNAINILSQKVTGNHLTEMALRKQGFAVTDSNKNALTKVFESTDAIVTSYKEYFTKTRVNLEKVKATTAALKQIAPSGWHHTILDVLTALEAYEELNVSKENYKGLQIRFNKLILNTNFDKLPSELSVEVKDSIINIQDALIWLTKFASSKFSNLDFTEEIDDELMSMSSAYGTLIDSINTLDSFLEKIYNKYEDDYIGEIKSLIEKQEFAYAIKVLETFSTSSDRPKWAKFISAFNILQSYGFSDAFTYIKDRNLVFAPEENDEEKRAELTSYYVEAWFRSVLYSTLINDMLQELDPSNDIDIFDISIDKLQKDYAALDETIRNNEHQRLIAALYEHREVFKESDAYEDITKYVRKQGKIKKGHDGIFRQVQIAKDYILNAVPCFMMSPKTVSELLPPNVKFDVVIYDEASQITVPNAINSIYRANQVVIVGDELQMPPTRFFLANTNTEDEDDEGIETSDYESIIKVADSTSIFNRDYALKVHYRSKHESLIWFSKTYFYQKLKGILLQVPPSSKQKTDGYGVEWVESPTNSYIPNDSKSGIHNAAYNPVEAKMVADMVVAHYKNHPDKTLGVIAFSSRQQAAIESEIELAKKANPSVFKEVEEKSESRFDSLFVKNLENVQGDERDFIILSVGYGPDANGKVKQFFGPLSRDGGYRRLNVAITRAKEKFYVVSSMHADHITVDSEGAKYLAFFLEYAMSNGDKSIEYNIEDIEGEADSPFELEVGQLIESWGYTIKRQVGVESFSIDIGVMKEGTSDTSHIFGLGIECDGASYHSSVDARNRDIIRQEVLENHGWDIYRIWSTKWFKNRKEAEAELRKAVEKHCGMPSGKVTTMNKSKFHKAELDSIYTGKKKEYLNRGIML